jgi:superfamily II DNA or RNA helicase
VGFKIGGGSSISLETPESMFRDFSNKTIQGVLTHQGRVLNDYQANALTKTDVAIKLPTGSGKTLVGLLIAEWRRRQNTERVVYVCPTRQLVNQVADEASAKYGMHGSVIAFTGRQASYEADAKARYQSGEAVAVTTYGGLFNANPFFADPHLIIFDDAHAAENYIASYWTLEVRRADHEVLFSALASALSGVLSPPGRKEAAQP